MSCGQWDRDITVRFTANWMGNPVDCSSDSPALTDLRFYVSNLQLVDAKGVSRDVRFATEFSWQSDAVALVDLEDGSGSCLNGTSEVQASLIGVAPHAEYRGLKFTIGVPFRINHGNPLAAGAPLDDSDMHWHWRSGYKFMRAGLRTETDGFWIHTGSAGCEGTVGHITGCRFPNRVEVILPEFVPGEHEVSINLENLLSGTDLGDGIPSDCSSGPPETACIAPYAAFGIDFTTGKQSGQQSVFSAQ